MDLKLMMSFPVNQLFPLKTQACNMCVQMQTHTYTHPSTVATEFLLFIQSQVPQEYPELEVYTFRAPKKKKPYFMSLYVPETEHKTTL
jgi:hypothetical protein